MSHVINKWLPVGGHIEQNETPDEALLREIKEETNLDVELLNKPAISEKGNVKEVLAVPFHVIVHQFNLLVFYWCTIREPTPKNLVGSL